MFAAPPLQRGYLRSPGEGLVRLPQADDSVTPMSFAGLVAWWKADSYALADNTRVFGTGKEWLDQSGNGNHIVDRGAAGQDPLFRTNQVNGLPAIVGNGSSEFGWTTSNIVLGNTNWTVIIITGGLNAGGGLMGRSPSDGRMSAGSEGNNVIATPFNSTPITGQSTPFTFGVSHRRMNTFMVRAGFHRYYENATDRTQATPIPCTNPLTLNLVMHDGINASLLNGKLCEIAIYNQARADAELAALHATYFKPRWAVE